MITIFAFANYAQTDINLAVRKKCHIDLCWKLDRIHEGFLYLIEDDDTNAQQYDHKGKAIA